MSSTESARIIAFKVLVAYRAPWASSVPVSHFLPGNLPSLLSVYDHGQLEGTPLPARWHHAAASLLERIAHDTSEGETMRHAARRALMFFAND